MLTVHKVPHANLVRCGQVSVAPPTVVDGQVEDTEVVRHPEFGPVLAIPVGLHGAQLEGVHADELQLDVGGPERLPVLARDRPFGNIDGISQLVLCAISRRIQLCLVCSEMM
eukprot:19457_1